ncbi:MAG: chromosome segregation protein SMC, partial [Oscillospiraceae bacterium]|nr:chromosome segregation protein SMC [Oscillospiraceae bacterium]
MILKALEMQGFKSFPDKTVLSFGSGMTSVVGPNGSGKSNISDAVRWVLGEQGAKKLRGAKMEDVIFGGTSARKAQGFAEVSLKLDNSDRVLGKDADEVVVTRRYYRSGESEYKVNGEVVRLKDVHELFMDTGLGRDGYSMVSQGKIADMVSSKSNERREMFEEAAGISFFRYRRADALRRLDQTQENLIRLKDIFTELQTRVGPLKEQSETARKFLVLAQEKKELEISLWLHTIEKAKDNLRRQEDKIALAGSQHDDSAGELESIEEKIEQIIKKSQDITVEIDNIRRGISLFEEQASAVDSNIAVCKNTIELNLQAIERIKKDKSQTKETQGRIDDQIKQAQESITVCEKLAQEKREELGAVYGQLEDLLEENNESTGKTQGLSNKMGELARELSDKRVIESTAESSSREIRSRLGAIDQSLSENDQLIAELLRDKDEGQSVIKSKIDEIEEYTNAVNGYGLKVKNREGKVSKLREEADRLSIDLRQKESKRGMLLEMEKNMEGYSGSVKAVIKESKRGTMRGVHGPVSQLITVDSKYSHAIEVALGAAIQNIVVDTENDAKRAINFLKEQKLGRATFLPICAIKQRELNEKGVGSCDGFIGIASDLVKCDEKYTDIVKSLLARTVVADEMDSAIKVAKKYANRFKIVTLDGQVINAGGSMTGGSRIHNSGLLGRGNEIEKINKEIKKLSEKARQSADSYKSAVEELAADRAGLMGAQAQLTTAQEEKIMADSEMTLVSGRIEAAKSSKEELVREKESAILRIEEFKKQSEEAQVRIAELSEQIKGIESEIEKMTGR